MRRIAVVGGARSRGRRPAAAWGVDGISFTVHPLGPCRPFDQPRAVGIGPDRHLTCLAVFWFESLDSDGAAAKRRGDLAAAAGGTVAAALASKLAGERCRCGTPSSCRNTSRRRCPRTRTPARIPGKRCRRLAGAPRRAGEALSLGTRHYSSAYGKKMLNAEIYLVSSSVSMLCRRAGQGPNPWIIQPPNKITTRMQHSAG